MKDVSRLLDVPSTDADDARRRRLLNVLLLGTGAIAVLALLATTVASAVGLASTQRPEVALVYLAGPAMIFGAVIIFATNRYWSGWLASVLFLLLLTGVLAFSDEPRQVVEGRSMFLFAIPILLASVLLRPWASFIIAGLSSLAIAAIALGALHIVPPVPSMLSFFAIALVAWLAARSLEQALEDLRTINAELDQRAEERTQQMAEALSRNQAILDGIADGVIVFDNDGKAVVANPAMARLLGRPSEEIIGRGIDMLMGENVDAADQEVINDFLRDKVASHFDLKFQWGERALSVSLASVQGNSGEVTGTVAVFRDFTREAEVERMKNAFVSMASHELRTPLNAILGYAEMLEEGVFGVLPEKQRNTVERVVINTGHLLDIVNNLLNQAQIEAGTLTLEATPFVLADLVGGVLGVMDVLAQAKGLELTSHITDGLPVVLFGDRQRLHQILVNLVGNAIKFTDEGTVHVRAYRFDAENWGLEVSDTGSGIPPEAQSYIFEPFRQVDESPTREHAGVGLGLSIVKQLISMMGGEITLESRVGRGSTFTVVLPLVPPAWSQPKAAKPKNLP
jgi:PAS domain S-box-containing protein